MAQDWRQALRMAVPDLPMLENVPMAGYTTLRLGGPADLLCEPVTEAQLSALLRMAGQLGVPVTLIGHGSNLLVLDGGIRGLVIRMAGGFGGITRDGEILTAQAGCALSTLARQAAQAGLAGLAFAAGIPGTVGGGAWMNAGAYGGELSQVIAAVRGLRPDGTTFAYTVEEMAYSYRHSRLMEEPGIITLVTLRLEPDTPEAIFAHMAELAARRAEKQPLNERSAGSTFKRPEGAFAAALIEQCGLKGFAIGGASVSEKHAGFLISRGGTAADFLGLMAEVRRRVADQTGIVLEPEVRVLGEALPNSIEHDVNRESGD